MKREFIVAVRGEEDRILVLEPPFLTPSFPGGRIKDDATNFTGHIQRKVLADTGLVVAGLHLHGVSNSGREVHRYSAYVTGGRLHTFPTARTVDAEGYLSASWMSLAMALQLLKLATKDDDMKELVTDLRWLKDQRDR